MPHVPTRTLLDAAVAAGRAVPAFNVLHLETVEALATAAEASGVGIVLQISERCVQHHGALAPLAAACVAVAEASPAPLALHLDHATDPRLVHEAIAMGFGSVMIDLAARPFDDNVAGTRAIVERAQPSGVLVEAELGEIGGKLGAHAPGVRTDPEQARAFVEATGVALLAVAVGSEHAMHARTAELDLALVARLAEAVDVPLVLHGSSGVPDAGIVAAIDAGIRKVNVSTQLVRAGTDAVRLALADPSLVDSRAYLGAGRDAVASEAARLAAIIGRA